MSDAVMVPRVPTDEMLDAADEPFFAALKAQRDANVRAGRAPDAGYGSGPISEAIWAAMLAASTPVGGWQDIATVKLWDDGIVTDGTRAAFAQKAEADYGGFYWACDGGNGALEWEPTHFIAAPPPPSVSTDNGSRPQEAVPTEQAEGAVLTFGLGRFVVDTGSYHQTPAVFICPVDKPGMVGASSQELGHDRHTLLPGEMVLTFPFFRQAEAVADALVTPPQPADGCSSNEGAE